MMVENIYFDNAATTWPKPRSVYLETLRAMRECGGNPGRGAHRLSRLAAETVYNCREAIAQLVGCPNPEQVVFTLNATAALNTAIKGCLESGDHVLISDMEHNSVYRPIYQLASEGKISYGVFPTYPERRDAGRLILAGLAERIRPTTKAVVCAHSSNICSAVLPLREIGSFCKKHGILLIVDASQSIGHLPLQMEQMGIDVLCAPGHKGLYGPMGSGFLVLREGVRLKTLAEGGSGVHSLEGEMPEQSPERYEAGTVALPAIAGLHAGIREVISRGPEAIREHDVFLFEHLRDRLDGLPGMRLYVPEREGSVLLFHVDGIGSEQMGELLDARGIAVRCGFHCSALGHRTLGTPEDGAVRVSFGMFNTLRETDRFADCVTDLLRRYL